jgi:hypothetical protein
VHFGTECPTGLTGYLHRHTMKKLKIKIKLFYFVLVFLIYFLVKHWAIQPHYIGLGQGKWRNGSDQLQEYGFGPYSVTWHAGIHGRMNHCL